MNYLNFDIEIVRGEGAGGDERVRVRVLNSPVDRHTPAQAEEVTLPADLRLRARMLARRQLDTGEMIRLGGELGSALLPGGVRAMFDRSRERLREGEGLRIRLAVDSYRLADLPWEYAHLPDPARPPSHGFLVFDPSVSLVRYEVLGRAPSTLEPVRADALRMIVILAASRGGEPLNLGREQQIIKGALQGLRFINPEFYPDSTIETLLDAISSGAHIFHYSGHAEFRGDLGIAYGSQEGQGYLKLGGDGERESTLAADKLALNLAGSSIRLAVLNACETSKGDQINAWTGIASALTRSGIPAVVGMQFTIRDENSIGFSRAFYRALAAGKTVDEAVTDGRRTILTMSADQDERDWGVPVLYLRAEEGVLFPARGDGGATAAAGRDARGRPALITDPGVDKRALRTAMTQAFSIEELESLCFDLQQDIQADAQLSVDVSLELIGGTSKTAKVLNLIEYLDRRGLLAYLVKAVRSLRPSLI